MASYMNANTFANKIEWEGGIVAALEYGLKHTALDPDDHYSADLRAAYKKVEDLWNGGFAVAVDDASEAVARALCD